MTAGPPSAEDRTIAGLWGLSVAAALLVVPIRRFLPLVLPSCLFHAWTGLPCPACGTTRAALALLDGHPLLAITWNPLAALAGLAFLAGGLAASLWVFLARRALPAPRLDSRLFRVAAVAGLAGNWMYLVWAGV